MTSVPTSGAIVYHAMSEIDAIEEHSRRLVGALADIGVPACYHQNGLSELLAGATCPPWILLQYNPFRWGRNGFAPGLLADVLTLRRRGRALLSVMVHEAWIDMTGPKSSVIGAWQRTQLRLLLRVADRVMASTEAVATQLGRDVVHVPPATNISPVPSSPRAARRRLALDDRVVLTLFGRNNPSRALEYAEAAIQAVTRRQAAGRTVVLNLGSGAPAAHVPAGVEVREPGVLDATTLSLHLWSSDLVLLPFTDGLTTRRTTLMAALAHGRPVIALDGPNTDTILRDARDAVCLTPLGDPDAFAQAAVELTEDAPQRRALGEAGQELYEREFDWPVLARKVADVVDAREARPDVVIG